jgi:hypothetical protein
MLNSFSLLAALALLPLTSSHAATTINCSAPAWIEPAKIENGVFVAHLIGSCDLTGVTHANVEKLYQYYIAQQSINVAVVNSPPTANSSLAPVGTIADLTVNMDDGTMRSVIRIGTDLTSAVFYSSRSQEINFSGFASLMQKLDLDIRIEKATDDHFKISLINLTQVKKPRLMPNFTFLGPASSQSIKQFQTSLNQLGQTVADQL